MQPAYTYDNNASSLFPSRNGLVFDFSARCTVLFGLRKQKFDHLSTATRRALGHRNLSCIRARDLSVVVGIGAKTE